MAPDTILEEGTDSPICGEVYTSKPQDIIVKMSHKIEAQK